MKISSLFTKKFTRPLVIAEISANHNGSLKKALETITAAKESGADAVKIQTYTADTMTIDCDKPDFVIKGGIWNGYKLYDLYKWAQTPYEWHRPLFRHAKKIGITLFSTPFDESAVNLLEGLKTPAYKIASFELVDLPLIQYVARTRKPMILSTGMASENEIKEAVTTAKSAGCKQLALLHCVSSYPTPLEQAHIRQISVLNKKFKVPVGLSDHTLGTTAAIAAAALGACIIEKHFTMSRTDKSPDCEFSMEPQEFKNLCDQIKEAWLSLGGLHFRRERAEESNCVFRRSIYFVKNLPANHKIKQKDIRCIRPGMGLHPRFLKTILNTKTKTEVTRGTPVNWRGIKK